MKKHHSLHVLLIIVALTFLANQVAARSYYISENGSDTNSGSKDHPIRTFEHVSTLLQPGDTCFVLQGHYHEEAFISALNGTKDRPVVFMAYPGHEVILDGTIPIDSEWSRIEKNIFKTRIETPVWQLFIDQQSMSSARWPNGNWIDGSVWNKQKSMCWPEKGKGETGHYHNKGLEELDFSLENGGIIIVNSGSFKTYKSWVTKHQPGSDEIQYDRDLVKVHFSYHERIERHGFFLEGKKELIDVENEWFFEPEDSLLYVYFEKGTTPEDHDIRGKNMSYTFSLQNCNYIVIKGFILFGTTVNIQNSTFITLEDNHFKYPSYSKRMLRDLSPVEVTKLLVDNEYSPSYDTIRNCIIEYADGPAMELNGKGNFVENCLIHHIDYSCTYAGGYTLNMINATDLVFRRNTIHTTGASETFKAGRRNLIELNNISRTGYLQNDGSMVQVSVKQQDQSETRYNWVHDSEKQGLRFDNSNLPNSTYGENGTLHHNVAWKTDRIFFKGDRHYIYNNLVFDSHLNDLIISSDTLIQGWNYNTITRNNICNNFSGSRTKPGSEYPVPGIADHNWAGNFKKQDIRTQLRDPDNLDFRPRENSELVDAGAKITGKEMNYIGKAPDIGPYEYGTDHYWIAGYKAGQASTPVPPDQSTSVKEDADLMWLEGYHADSHDVYFGMNAENVMQATRDHETYKGNLTNNIFHPPVLEAGRTYYWRVDVMKDDETIKGELWTFTIQKPN